MNVHYRIHNSKQPFRILSQNNPVHASPSHFCKIHFNIRISSTPSSSKWPLFRRSPHQNPICNFAVRYTCYMLRLSHYSWFDHPNNIWWLPSLKLLIMYIFHSTLTSFLLVPSPKYLPQYPILEHPHPMLLPQRHRLNLTLTDNRQSCTSVQLDLYF